LEQRMGGSLLFLLLFVASALSISVSLMLPLDAVGYNGLNYQSKLYQNLKQIKQGGVDGFMVDVWWGLVENEGPKSYNWTAYLQIAQMAQALNLSMQPIMSFHQCGTNIGDSCYIPLPQWILKIGSQNKDIWYRDQQYNIDEEYLSLGADNNSLFEGRTAVQLYSDFMRSFANNFGAYLGSTINQVHIGLGPAGEMRYPSYQLQDNKWQYCGIGEFQCYDKYMLQSLRQASIGAGHPEWGNSGPDNAGSYDSNPDNTAFFTGGFDNYASSYGQFFLKWYSSALINHGSAILSRAKSIFGPTGASISAKVSGIHWWYADPSHAAEATAGYYNTNQNNAYLEIATMLAGYGATFDFTALEMTDGDSGCGSRPNELVQQTLLAAKQAGIGYAGENALPLCDPNCYQGGFDQIYTQSTRFGPIESFTYLRMNDNLLNNQNNWYIFTRFVARMHAAG